MTNLTAEQAITRSSEYDEIVTIEGSPEAHETLSAECSDYIERYVGHEDGYTLTEYWKNDSKSSDGMLWRVHVRDTDVAVATIEDVVAALKHLVEVHIDDPDSGHVIDYAPDSSDDEYAGNTEPGSAWDEECDRLIAEIRESLPEGWKADWSDNDLRIERA